MSMPTNKEINVPYKTNTVEKYPYIVYAEIENKLKFLEGSIDELESSLPSTAFTDTNTVKKYIDDAITNVDTKIAQRAICFDTVADMAAATDLAADMICHTNGFHTSGDGGAAFYEIKSTGTANAMDIIACQDSLLAHLVVTEPFVTPEQFGAYGDGTHDDSTVFAKIYEYGNIELASNKTYLINNADFSLDHNIIINGNGAKLMCNSNIVALLNLSPTVDGLNIVIKNIIFDCRELAATGFYMRHLADGADINYMTTLEISDCSFLNMKNYVNNKGTAGIEIYTGTKNITISNCYFDNAIKGVKNDNTIACRFITIANTLNSIIDHCYFNSMDNATDTKLDVDCIGIISHSRKSKYNKATVTNCTFKDTITRCIKISGCSSFINNNTFDLTATSLAYVIDNQGYDMFCNSNTFLLTDTTNTGSGSVRLIALSSDNQTVKDNFFNCSNSGITEEYFSITKRENSNFDITIENNKFVTGNVPRFIRSSIDNTVSGALKIFNNISDVNLYTFFNNWTSLENISIDIQDNISNHTNKTGTCVQAGSSATTLLKSIYLKNNNINEWVNFASLDFAALNNCRFESVNTTASNAPSGMPATIYGSVIEVTPSNTQNRVMYMLGSDFYIGMVNRS